MAKSKAIEILRSLQEPEAWEPQIMEDVFDALEMAIDALEQQMDKVEPTWDNLPTECRKCRHRRTISLRMNNDHLYLCSKIPYGTSRRHETPCKKFSQEGNEYD